MAKARIQFENDEKMYGTQAVISLRNSEGMFENDVKMYGTQAPTGKHRSSTTV